VTAEQSAEVLLYELNHRIRNNFAMIASVLELQKRSVKEEAAKDAFASAVARVHVIANAHDHLLPKEGQSLIDMREYLTVCCQNLGDALRDVRPIAVNVSAAQILLRDDRAVSIGLIVNELVTNAFKYAFSGTSYEELAYYQWSSASARHVAYSAIRIRPSGARLANALEPTCSVAALHLGRRHQNTRARGSLMRQRR